ncbi:MAG: protein kinase, partial [Anaerolineae bacterium]
MPLNPGQILRKRYRIEALLGHGGMGSVYRALDLGLDIPVAIKENRIATPEAQRQFSREAGILARLRHPNLPRVADHFSVPGLGQYLVMDYVQGADLQEVLGRQGTLPETRALAWIGQVLDALEYLHAQNIIHRDVKPANVKITPEGQVFLVDFGLAKVYDPLQRTTVGARGVTPGYAPPEQYGHGRTDARTDVYSVGATLYTLLTGQTPPDALEYMMGQADLVSPRQVNPSVQMAVDAAIVRAMEPLPGERFQTAAEFREALVGRRPASSVPAKGKRTSPRRRPGQRAWPTWWMALGVGSAILVTTIVLVSLFGGGFGGNGARTPAVPSPTDTRVALLTETPLPVPTQPSTSIPVTLPPTVLPSTTPPPTTPSPTSIVQGDSLIRLTNDPADEYVPSYSPGGQYVVYMSNRDGPWQIYLMNADGTGARQLTSNDADNYHPRFSPDGKQITFASKMDGDWDVYIMDLEGQIIRQVTDWQGDQYYPFFSPDGLTLSLMDDASGGWQVLLIDVAGNLIENLTSGPAHDTYAAFAPDGRHLVLQSNRDGNWEIYSLDLADKAVR